MRAPGSRRPAPAAPDIPAAATTAEATTPPGTTPPGTTVAGAAAGRIADPLATKARATTASGPGRPAEENAGWSIFGYLLSGMAFYGLAGWLISRAVHMAVLFPVGMLVGLVLAMVLIVLKHGRA